MINSADSGGGEPGVSAVVVNFETGGLLTHCVESLVAAAADEIIVVDNASSDDSVRRLRAAGTPATIVEAGGNRGFGAGANLGVRRATGDVLLVCNPDLVVSRTALAPLRAVFAEQPDVAAAGPQILTLDGEVYPSARTFPSLAESAGHAFVGLLSERNRWTRSYKHATDLAGGGPVDVDWVSGACAAFRREAFESVGGFDERYFMYVEDVDLCWRLRRAGWRVLYVPESSITHVQGASTRLRPYRMIAAHHRSMWRFANKSTAGHGRAALPAVAAGLSARLALASAKYAWSNRGRSER